MMDGSIHNVPFRIAKAAIDTGKTPQEKADNFNLIAAIADEDNDLDKLVQNFIKGDIPKIIEPKQQTPSKTKKRVIRRTL